MATATEVHGDIARQHSRATQCLQRCESYALDSTADRRLIELRKRIETCVRDVQKQYQPILQQLNSLKTQIDQIPQHITNRPNEREALQQQLKQQQESYDRINSEVPEFLVKGEALLSTLLDEAVRFEHQIKTGEALRASSKAEFAKKEVDFKEAQTYHLNSAWRLLSLMALLILGTGGLLWVFSKPPAFLTENQHSPISLSSINPSSAKQPNPDRDQWIAGLVFLSFGRLAMLFFAGWALRFLAGLHRDHSEQAIMYRDRRAALGVVETMLEAAPDVEQKKKIIETLSAGYLDFDKNAFRRKEEPRSDGDFKSVKELVDSVKPLFDSVKGLLERK